MGLQFKVARLGRTFSGFVVVVVVVVVLAMVWVRLITKDGSVEQSGRGGNGR